MMKAPLNGKRAAYRALRTFIQAFAGVLVAAFADIDCDESFRPIVLGAVVSATAAGLSAVMNLKDKTV